jgi:alkaline phosphatase D
MRSAAIVAAAAVLLVSAAEAAAFRYGVTAGEITSTSAVLWTRADSAGTVTLEVLLRKRVVHRERLRAAASRDLTVQTTVRRLRPGTTYRYRFRGGRGLGATGRFETAPAPRTPATVEFAISGDADGTRNPQTGRPAYNLFGVYAQMAREGNDFNLNIGDTMYSDSRFAPRPALTVPQKWGKYRENLAFPALALLRRSTGGYSHWDDHEFINDFTPPEHGAAIYRAGVQAFRDYMPVTYTARDGIYRTFRWGRNVELFFLDERSFRSAKASAAGACDNPPGSSDLAPTAPQAVRAQFAALASALASPPPAACVARIRDPARTMLGARQLERFLADVRASTARFKVIVNELPLMQFYALPYDRWEGYEPERQRVLQALSQVPGAVVLTTDQHAAFVKDAHLRTLEPGGPVPSGVLEVVTGAVASETYGQLIDGRVGAPGSGVAINGLFFQPIIRMDCAVVDKYSYAQVRATSRALTIVVKDDTGLVLREADGTPCGPFTVRAG